MRQSREIVVECHRTASDACSYLPRLLGSDGSANPDPRSTAVPFRIFGITQSKMNPNICTICERAFGRVQKHQHVTAIVTILFADTRGYTRLSERMDPVEMSEIVSVFKASALKPSGAQCHREQANGRWPDGNLQLSD